MAQTGAQDFEGLLQDFLVDLNGDGKPDAVMQAQKQQRGGVLDMLPEPDPVDPAVQRRYDADRALLRYGDDVIIPGTSWPEVGHALMGGLQRIGDVGQAVQATGGPPGAIVGGAMRAMGHGPAWLARTARGFTQSGQMRNALDDAEVALSRAAPGEIPPRARPIDVPGLPRPTVEDNLIDTRLMTEAIERGRARTISDQANSAPTTQALADQRGRFPPQESPRQFQRQGEGIVRSRADPDVAREMREQGVIRQAQERSGIQARESLRQQQEAPLRQRQAQADDIARVFEDLVPVYANVPRYSPESNISGLINDVAEITGAQPWQVIRAMTDKGYDLSGLTRASFQAPRDAGRFAPMTDESRALWDMIRYDQDVLYRQRGAPYQPEPRNALMPPTELPPLPPGRPNR